MSEIARTRIDDPETSHDAAASIGDVRKNQQHVLHVLADAGPLTDELLVRRYTWLADEGHVPRQSPSGVRSRRAELVRHGLVEWTGERAPISTGRLARIWQATPRR